MDTSFNNNCTDLLPSDPSSPQQQHSQPIKMKAGTSKMLTKLGLTHNPYVDRTAEKSCLGSGAFYLHSDLQGFKPSDTTYVFFGKRGVGKTSIRLMMMQVYEEHNEELIRRNQGPVFVVDLCRPSHMDDCLKHFMASIGADRDNWDSHYSENWTSSDLADCIVSFAINSMMRCVVLNNREGKMIMESLSNNPRSATQFLLLSHLYTREDSATLRALRAKLLPIAFSSMALVKTTLAILAGAITIGGTALALRNMREPSQDSSSDNNTSNITASFPESLMQHVPHVSQKHLALAGVGVTGVLSGLALRKRSRAFELARAQELCDPVRVADARPDLLEPLINSLFSSDDTADRIRGLHIGHSTQQKLELIENLTKACGFQGLAVFGDCFDEVGLLDPLLYPSAVKVFAREVCKNEVLNQGSLHFFFPDARASLDLSTDRIVREARFDRHFVRDLTWSRFQLADLAERRFLAAQDEAAQRSGQTTRTAKFSDLFQHVSKEDYHSALSKLQTPRELMVFMTELLARVESHSEDGAMVAAQDMEIAVQKAQEQSV